MSAKFDASLSWLFDAIGDSGEIIKKKAKGKYRINMNTVSDVVDGFSDRPSRQHVQISYKNI